jgi:hypothetical protein
LDEGDLGEEASVCGEELGGQVIGPLDHQVVPFDEVLSGVWGEAVTNQAKLQVGRVFDMEAVGRHLDFGRTLVCLSKEELTVQVGHIDSVVIDEREVAQATLGEHRCDGVPQPPDADEQNLGVDHGKYSPRLK